MSDPKRWTKKDLRVLTGCLDSAWLLARPLSNFVSERDVAATYVRERLSDSKVRLETVLDGLRGRERLHRERYSTNCECVGNEVARFGKSLDDELVARFVAFAREEDAALKKATELRERVQREGLPPEALEYDPTEEGKR